MACPRMPTVQYPWKERFRVNVRLLPQDIFVQVTRMWDQLAALCQAKWQRKERAWAPHFPLAVA